MSDRDQGRTSDSTGEWDTGPEEDDDRSRYAQALSEYNDDPEYRVSSDPAGVRGSGVGGRPIWPWLLLGLAVVLAAWAWIELKSADDGSDEVPLPTAEIQPEESPLPALDPPTEEPVAIELPALDASDQLVTELVAGLSARPDLARLLVGEGLVRRFTAAVENIAQGGSPRAHLPALAPDSKFTVTEADGRPRPTPEAYRRYDRLVAIFASLDTEGTAELYRQLRPLIDEAYRDLGYPDSEFDEQLRTAIDHLLATPNAPAGSELRARGIGKTFEFVDERYENLSSAQKHLLRMGPDNASRVQGKLLELRAALDL